MFGGETKYFKQADIFIPLQLSPKVHWFLEKKMDGDINRLLFFS